jgi:hypothetical protein
MGTEYTERQTGFDPCRISKATIDSTGITPVYEKVYGSKTYPMSLIPSPREYINNFFDWERGVGYRFLFRNPQGELTVNRFDFRSSETSVEYDTVGTFAWRNYIWRTYENAPTGRLTFTHFKDGGYVLSLPDPDNSNTTQVLRIDPNGNPLLPENLESGGNKNSLDFDRMPSTVEPNIYFYRWTKRTYRENIPDSAQLLFWGLDNEGTLYSYHKVRKY